MPPLPRPDRSAAAASRHVALLRGVNVGGHNRVPMAGLRALALSLGHADPTTYLASGNLVFSSPRPDAALAAELSAALEAHFGFAVDVLVVGPSLMRRAAERHPFADGDPRRVHVGFCSLEVPAFALDRLKAAARAPERVQADGSLLFLDFAAGVHSSALAGRLNTLLAPGFVTARNLQTVRALLGLLAA